MKQTILDKKNAEFWNELCGSSLARSIGISDASPESLQRFDEAYFAMYPYLEGYVSREPLENKKVLEIGLGYGTLGQLLASKGCHYYGLDISVGPVAMMRERLARLGQNNIEERVVIGSALAIPHKDASFDYVYTIGCLHHTGNLTQAISEVYRVLAPSGRAIVMLYNRYSFFQFVWWFLQTRKKLKRLLLRKARPRSLDNINRWYDVNSQGVPAPHTDYVSYFEAKRLHHKFNKVEIDIRNFERLIVDYKIGLIKIDRHYFINNIDRICGLDLYITATK